MQIDPGRASEVATLCLFSMIMSVPVGLLIFGLINLYYALTGQPLDPMMEYVMEVQYEDGKFDGVESK